MYATQLCGHHRFQLRPEDLPEARHGVNGVDQLWVADLTYIRLAEEFVYLALVLDASSRRVKAWELDRTIEDDRAIAALRMALSQLTVLPGLVHPWDHVGCESFMKEAAVNCRVHQRGIVLGKNDPDARDPIDRRAK